MERHRTLLSITPTFFLCGEQLAQHLPEERGPAPWNGFQSIHEERHSTVHVQRGRRAKIGEHELSSMIDPDMWWFRVEP